jgi:hypothetical protein
VRLRQAQLPLLMQQQLLVLLLPLPSSLLAAVGVSMPPWMRTGVRLQLVRRLQVLLRLLLRAALCLVAWGRALLPTA